MLWRKAAEDWIELGDSNPYYGVLSGAKFGGSELDEQTFADFYQSGAKYVSKLKLVMESSVGWPHRGTALDFGCGVGRLTLALAQHFTDCLGLDVSPGMLDRARNASHRLGVGNATFATSHAAAIPSRKFDFVNSYIVFQHIPVALGEDLFRKLVSAVSDGGCAALHLTTVPAINAGRAAARNFVKRSSLLRPIANIVSGRNWREPAMEMNHYRMERLIAIMADEGIQRFTVVPVADWRNPGAFIIFRRDGFTSPWWNPKPYT